MMRAGWDNSGRRGGWAAGWFAWVAALCALVTGRAVAVPPPAEGWREQIGVTGVSGTVPYTVRAMINFDEDGAGPRPPYMIAGGSFTVAGNCVAKYIGAWDGSAWRALGAGFDAPVWAVTIYNGELIAAGEFQFSGAQALSRIARWTNAGWQPLGTGVNDRVRALCVYNGVLYAGGDFTSAGGQSASRIAQWNGTSWSALGQGVSGGAFTSVCTMVEHQGTLVVGGEFATAGTSAASNLAVWNGSAWSAFSGGGLPARVRALTVYNGSLYAGGFFDAIVNGLRLRYVAGFLNNQWRPVGAGLTPRAAGFYPSEQGVHALLVRNGQLVVAGEFDAALDFAGNPLTASGVAVWDGSQWFAAGGAVVGVDNIAHSVCDYAGKLMVGGMFERAGGMWVRGIAGTDGFNWFSLVSGISNRVLSLTSYAGKLIVGGPFASIGGINANSIAQWDGTTWTTLSTGITGAVPQTYALTTFNGELIAAGFFEFAGGVPVKNVARWNGTQWSAMGQGLNGIVRVLAVWLNPVSGQSELYAGGDFTLSGTAPCKRLARWNPSTQSWVEVGTGIADHPASPGDTGVYTLQGYQGRLYAGGYFTQSASGVTSPYLLTWDGSTFGVPPAGVVNDQVRALSIYNGMLFIGGYFTTAGGQFRRHVAAWDGVSSSWAALGQGLGDGIGGDGVTCMSVYNGTLVVGGGFTEAGTQTGLNRIARWNGTAWSPMDVGLDTIPNAVFGYDPDGLGPRLPVLAAGGEFGTAGGRVSPFFAVWGPISDSIWNAVTGGDGALAANWLHGAIPDQFQSVLFDNTLSAVSLAPQYRVTLSAALTAKRLTVNSNQVTLDLTGRNATLTGVVSDFDPPLSIGRRAGASTDVRLLLSNTGAPATFRSPGAVIGNVVDPANFFQLGVRDAGLTARIEGNLVIAPLAKGTLEITDGATLRYGLDSTSYVGTGFFPAPTSTANATINVLSGGKLESAVAVRDVSIGSTPGARAQVTISGAGSRWTTAQGDFFVGDQGIGNLSILAGGELVTTTTNSVIIGRAPTSSAQVAIGAGSKWQEVNRDINVGGGGGTSFAQVRLSSGSTLKAPAINLLPGGSIIGTGTVDGDVYNFGTLNPGTDAPLTTGALTITGTYRQFGLIGGKTGIVTLDVKSATQFDQLLVTGPAELAGGLRVNFDPSFTPIPPNLDVELVRAASFVSTVQRTFDVAVLPALNDGRYFRVQYPEARGPGPQSVRLVTDALGELLQLGTPDTATVAGQPTAAVVGDFDGDGAEDLAITVPDPVNPTTTPGQVVVLFSAGADAQGNWAGFRAGPGGSIQVSVGVEPRSIDAGDFDGDGRLDLAIANASSNSVTVLKNTGNPSVPFSSGPGQRLTINSVGSRPVALTVANVHADPVDQQTAPEVIVVSEDVPALAMFSPTAGATSFVPTPGGAVALPAGSGPGSVTTFDPDQDKNLRRRHIGVGLNGSGGVLVIENDSPVSSNALALVTLPVIPTNPGPTQLVAANLRPPLGSTGDPAGNVKNRDLIVLHGGLRQNGVITNPGTSISVIIDSTPRGATNLSFRPPVSIDLGAPVLSLAALDQDLDADADLAILTRAPAGGTDTRIQVVRNDYLVRAPDGEVTQNEQPIFVPQTGAPDGGVLAKIVVAGRLAGRSGKPDDLATVADVQPGRGPGTGNILGIPNLGGSCSLADITAVGGSQPGEGLVPDGQITVDDLILFVNAFSTQAFCPGPPPCNEADIAGVGVVGVPPDGQLTVDDLVAFINAFIDGCP